MGMLEHVKVLESKVDKEIELAKRLMEENAQLREKARWYQQEIDDRDALIQAYKEEQHAIESGILSALNRLNQFEDTVEKKTRRGDSGESLEEETQGSPIAPAEPESGGEPASELEAPAEQD